MQIGADYSVRELCGRISEICGPLSAFSVSKERWYSRGAVIMLDLPCDAASKNHYARQRHRIRGVADTELFLY